MKKLYSGLALVFFLIVCFSLYQTVSSLDWAEVKSALEQFSLLILLPAIFIVFLDYAILASYDYLGFKILKIKDISALRIYISAFCCYAFNLNLGALVGGLGFRFRIYSGWGVKKEIIPKIILFSTVTNWLGHSFLLATVLCFFPESIFKLLSLPVWVSITIGVVMYFILLSYFVFCYKKKSMSLKGHSFEFPSLKVAGLQFILSSMQWVSLSTLIMILLKSLGHEIELARILFTSLVASIAGVLTHVPGGLGVLETVFIKANLGVPLSDLMAVLILYRALIYILPLALALPTYLGMEFYQKKVKPL